MIRDLWRYSRRYARSLNFAIEGVLHAAKTQKHVRFHLLAGAVLVIVCFTLGVEKWEFIMLTLMASVVIVAEMLNSALESVVDIISPGFSEKAKVAKDIAAGAVLISAVIAAFVGYYLLLPYFWRILEDGIYIAKHNPSDIAIGALVIVPVLVIIIKAYTGRGRPLHGGMPSGHTAFAFSIAVSTWFVSANVYFACIAAGAAIFVGLWRIFSAVHTWSEVFAGMLLGAGVTALLFIIFL